MSASTSRPGKIVCVGRNYLEHARELGNDVPERPLIFLKPPSSVIGEERQRASAREMAFAIPTLLAYISNVMTLEPGDVIATGTPAGVGPLAPGDVVEVEVVGFSTVRNPVAAAAV